MIYYPSVVAYSAGDREDDKPVIEIIFGLSILLRLVWGYFVF